MKDRIYENERSGATKRKQKGREDLKKGPEKVGGNKSGKGGDVVLSNTKYKPPDEGGKKDVVACTSA